MSTRTPAPWHVNRNRPVIAVYAPNSGFDDVALVYNGADAPLIAASPVLLSVLCDIRDYWMGGDCPTELWDRLTDAIDLAEGRTV